jgi:hypothetical protein
MAVAHENTSTAEATSVSSLTFSKTNTGTNLGLIVAVVLSDFAALVSISSVTYAGVTMTAGGAAVELTAGTQRQSCRMYHLAAPASGANNVVITLSGTYGYIAAGASSFTGVDQTTCADAYVTGSALTTTPSVAVTSQTSDMVVDVAFTGGNKVSIGAGQTQRWTQRDQVNTGSFGWGSTEAGAATVTMSWVMDSSNWTQAAINVRQVPAGGGFIAARPLLITGPSVNRASTY